MRYLLPLGCLVLALAGAAHGQTPRLRFLDLPASDRPIMGRFTLRISDDPFTRPSRARVVIRLDGAVIAECHHTPCDLAWETEGIANGRHLLQLVLLEEREDKTIDRILDEHTISIRNREPARRPPVDERKIFPAADPPVQAPDKTEVQRAGSAPARRDEVDQSPKPAPVETAVEGKSGSAANVKSSEELAGLNATAIALNGKKLAIGLMDGGITLYDLAEAKGQTVAGPAGAGEVRAIAAANGIVWWLTAPAVVKPAALKQAGPASPAAVVGSMLNSYRVSDGVVETFDVSAVGARFEPKQLMAWGRKVALVSDGSGALLDPKTGEFSDIDTVLPAEAVKARQHGATLRFAADGSTAVTAIVEDSDEVIDGARAKLVRIWRARGGEWVGGAREPVALPGAGAISVSLTTGCLALLSSEGVTTVGVSRNTDPRFTAIPAGVPAVDARSSAVCAGDETWWLRNGALFHASLESHAVDALFPWNISGMQPRSLAADRDGVWLATSAGVRRVNLESPDPEVGYGGFVRARLGQETRETAGLPEQRLAEAIESWQGTPYVWGGESRKGVDCSGFVMLAFREAGIDLPHGSDNLRGSGLGQVVRDELRYGDVLVYPGHAAIYIGNGQTAETVSTGKRGVGKSTVWRRSEVAVRRYLNVVAEGRTFASRGGKPPVPKSARTSTATKRKKRS